MALSGRINGSVTQKSNYFSFYLDWSATQNISENSSTVTVKTYWSTNNTYQGFDTVGSRNASITINGTTHSITKVFDVCASGSTSWATNPYLIQTATHKVYHNNDGTKTISISARANGHAAEYGPSYSTASAADCTVSSTNITLDSIARASTISSITSSVSVGSQVTVNINKYNSSFKHNVRFYIKNTQYDSGIIKVDQTSSSCSFTIPSSWANAMPSSSSCTATCNVQTCDSNWNQIGSYVSANFTVTLSSSGSNSGAPYVGPIKLEPEGFNGKLVQGKNRLKISVSGCSGGTGASISSYKFSGPGISTTTTNTYVYTGIVSEPGELTYTVTVENSRGQTTSAQNSITCYPYSPPSFTTFTTTRCNSDGSANSNGSHIMCKYNVSYYSVGGDNEISSVQIFVNGNSVYVNDQSSGTAILPIDSGSSLNVYGLVKDTFNGSGTSDQSTVYASRIFNAAADGMGFAIGKLSERTDKNKYSNGLFECAFDADFKNDIVVNGGANFKKDITVNNYTVLTSSNCTTHLNQYYAQKPILIMSYPGGISGSIGLPYDVSDFSYIEIYYCDNVGRQKGMVKYCPQSDGDYVTMSILEPITHTDTPSIYIRVAGWTISGNAMVPGRSDGDYYGKNQSVYAQIIPSTVTNNAAWLSQLGSAAEVDTPAEVLSKLNTVISGVQSLYGVVSSVASAVRNVIQIDGANWIKIYKILGYQ